MLLVLLVVVRNGNPFVIMNGRSLFIYGGGLHNLVYLCNGLRLSPMSVSISFVIGAVARVIRRVIVEGTMHDIGRGRLMRVEILLIFLPVGFRVRTIAVQIHIICPLGLLGVCTALDPECLIVGCITMRSDMFTVETFRLVKMSSSSVVSSLQFVLKDISMNEIGTWGVNLFFLFFFRCFLSLLGERLHLEDQVASLDRYIIGVENARVGIKTTRCLVPSAGIKRVKVIAPYQIEFVGFNVI